MKNSFHNLSTKLQLKENSCFSAIGFIISLSLTYNASVMNEVNYFSFPSDSHSRFSRWCTLYFSLVDFNHVQLSYCYLLKDFNGVGTQICTVNLPYSTHLLFVPLWYI